ncbi:MAG: DUF4397 domain-containing protein, partial [Blastochloris sp.]|nr:DUF4397 domain-containing protein [Blastochloris sp.]
QSRRAACARVLVLPSLMLGVLVMPLGLDAPFLAMIQITVYAGAIMVLFLFVIMLLGAERLQPDEPGEGRRRYRWFTRVASILVISFFVAFGASFLASNLDARELPLPDPQVQVVHAAPNVGPVEVVAGGTVLASELDFQEASSFIDLPAGEQTLAVIGGSGSSLTTTINLEPARRT